MRIAAGLFLVLLLAGCSDKDNTPSGIIPRVKMEKILWDMIQADQYAAIYLAKDSAKINVKMETLKLYEQVFKLHEISRDEFRKSFQYYQGRPDLTRSMLDTLVARGNQLRMDSYKIPNPGPATPAAVPALPVVASGGRAATPPRGIPTPTLTPSRKTPAMPRRTPVTAFPKPDTAANKASRDKRGIHPHQQGE